MSFSLIRRTDLCGNALRLDWLSVCPPTGTAVTNKAEDLTETPLDQAQVDFENEGGETLFVGTPYVWEKTKPRSKRSNYLMPKNNLALSLKG